MANTFTKTVAGKLCYFDGAGLADDTVITTANTEFTHIAKYPTSITEDWAKKTVGGVACLKVPADNTYEYNSGVGLLRNFGVDKSIFLQARVYRPVTNAQLAAGRKNPASGNLYLWVLDQIHGGQTWDVNGHTQYNPYVLPRSCAINTWHLWQAYSSYADGGHLYLKDVVNNYNLINSKLGRNYIGDQFGSADTDIWAIGPDARGATVYLTKILFAKNKYLTVTGLTAGMIVCLLDTSDNVIFSGKASGATVVFDLMGIEAPLNHKLQAIGTDGIELLKTDALTIYHGDTWTYSGDTAGISKSRKKIIVDGGVI
jgi:hypothetical protein